MRFSEAIQPHPLLLRTPAAADFLRRLLAAEPASKEQPAANETRQDDRPIDRLDKLPLDERVRLIGEW